MKTFERDLQTPRGSTSVSSRVRLGTIACVVLLLVSTACGGGDGDEAMDHSMEGMDRSMEEMDSMEGMDDSMGGMDVSSGEMDHSQHMMGGAPATRQPVVLTEAQERALGVVYRTVSRMDLERTIRTVGQIEAAESREAQVTPRVSGFVDDLLVNTTGEAVRRGQPLLHIYSPELVAAQEELLTALRLTDAVDPSAEEAHASARSMLDAARRRLAYWEISDAQVERLIETGEVTRTLTLTSPVNGVVLEKSVVEGQQVQAGMPLYRIADLSTVWVEGDVFEQDIQWIGEGTQAHIEVSAYPGVHLMGRVSFVYPTVNVQSRTNRVRVTLSNPDLRLKPGMFATMFFDTRIGEDVVAVPLESVIVTGERNLVFVREVDGTLQPRDVVLGASAGEYVEILSGLLPGEEIVGAANFLVDAESRLGSSGGSMPGMQHGSVLEPDTTSSMQGMEHVHD